MILVAARPVMAPRRVRRALRLFAEETVASRRAAAVGRLERETALRVARWFVAQGAAVVAALGPEMGPRMDAAAEGRSAPGRLTEEAAGISWDDWDYLLNQVMTGRHPGGLFALRDIISDGRTTAYASGAEAGLAELGVQGVALRFAVGSPAAVAHAGRVAAAQVTRINATTRDQLRTLITQAVEHGWSWNRTAEAITERYKDFAGKPLFPSRTYKSRAEMVAGYEINDAYEAGNADQAAQAAAEGLPMEKSWLHAGDARVRPAHRDNAASGWIPLDATFPDGSDRSPTDAGCRCAVAYRVSPDYFGEADPEPAAAVARAPIATMSVRPEYVGTGVHESVFSSEASERARQRAMNLSTRWNRYTRLGDELRDLDLQIALAIENNQPEEVIVALEKQLKRASLVRRRAFDHYQAGARSALALPESRRSSFAAAVALPGGRSQAAAQQALDEVRQFASAVTLPDGVRVRVTQTIAGSRAHVRGNTIFLTDNPAEHLGSTIFHEMGHVIEDNNETVSELAWAFRARRTRGESPVALNDLVEFVSYDAAELTYRDEFIDPYMGKVYGHGATEIVSSGLQYMRYSPEDLAERDPDYFHFMYHLLRGDLEYLAERVNQ